MTAENAVSRRKLVSRLVSGVLAFAAANNATAPIAETQVNIRTALTVPEWLEALENHVPDIDRVLPLFGNHLVDPDQATMLHNLFLQGHPYTFFIRPNGTSFLTEAIAELNSKNVRIGGIGGDSLNANDYPQGPVTDPKTRENTLAVGPGDKNIFQGEHIVVIGADFAWFTEGKRINSPAEFTQRLQDLEIQEVNVSGDEADAAVNNVAISYGQSEFLAEALALAAYAAQNPGIREQLKIFFEQPSRRDIVKVGIGAAIFAAIPVAADIIATVAIGNVVRAVDNATTIAENSSTASAGAGAVNPEGEAVQFASARTYKTTIADAYMHTLLVKQGKMKPDSIILSPWGDFHEYALKFKDRKNVWKEMQATIQADLRRRIAITKNLVNQINLHLAPEKQIAMADALQAVYDITVQAALLDVAPYDDTRTAEITALGLITIPQLVGICGQIAVENKLDDRRTQLPTDLQQLDYVKLTV